MRKLIFAAVAAAFMLSLAACGAGAQSDSPTAPSDTSATQSAQAGSAAEGEAAGPFSSFTAVDLNGSTVDQGVLQEAKITMVNVWATFCSPCISEMPDLGALHAAYADKNVQVIGIVTDVVNQSGEVDTAQVELAQSIVDKTGANYLHLLPSQDLAENVLRDVSVVPTTFFVDAQGNLLTEAYLGSRTQDEWSKVIDSLLETAQ